MVSRLLELALIAVLLVVLFGRNRLPDAVRSLRKSKRIMKAEMQAVADDVELPEPKLIQGEVVDRTGRADPKQR